MKCFSPDHKQVSHTLGSQGTTILTNIKWGDIKNSPLLQQLKKKCESGSNKLSIRVSYYYYTRNYEPLVPYRFTLGNVVGTIGVYNDIETLNFGGDRLMTSEGLDHPRVTFDQYDSCSGVSISKEDPWTSNAPFKLRDTGNKEVVVDLSNALPIKTDGTQRDIGELYLGYHDTDGNCLQLIEPNTPIPYMANTWLESGALAVYSLTNYQYQYLVSNSLMVIQKVQGNQKELLCGNLPSTKSESGIIVLKEREYFIRPLNYYVDRLEYDENTSSQTLYVTRYGALAQNVDIKIKQANYDTTLPIGGVAPDKNIKTTDAQGQVTFVFSVTKPIPYPRKYKEKNAPQCSLLSLNYTLPIDGQVYHFDYCILKESQTDCNPLKVSQITIKAYSTINYTSPYTWVDHVGVIFTHYNHLAPVMKSIVDLSNYTDVTLPWNIELIKYSMQLDFEHPNYMPATRDLSPTKQKMILEWLKDPKYSHESDTQSGKPMDQLCQHPPITKGMSQSSKFFIPPRCQLKEINLHAELKNTDSYFSDIFHDSIADIDKSHPRPLHGFLKKKTDKFCSVDKLKKQLQQAVQLEFYTIPLYLTAMYSIVDGCNVEIYNIIREVVMQEMMHMAQAANLLISMGETPVIDSPDFAPKYPAHGLPGGVLPNLQIDLKKLSLEHVYNVFMGIEVPTLIWKGDKRYFHDNTIGEFYEEILLCLDWLSLKHDDIINSSTVFKQVTWPWKRKDVELIKVDNVLKANEAIAQIIIQGEGFMLLPNSSLDGNYAHFFRFEEIVCQHKLVKVNYWHYAYSGDPILFDPLGVWPMRENPDPLICPNTNCFHAAKAFHHQYRGFLRKLQDTFSCETPDCNPQKLLMETVEMMEVLQVHAKKLMWIKFNPDNPNDKRTCGPVWTYNWDIICNNIY